MLTLLEETLKKLLMSGSQPTLSVLIVLGAEWAFEYLKASKVGLPLQSSVLDSTLLLQGAQVQFLVEELIRSCMQCSTAKIQGGGASKVFLMYNQG